MPRSEMELNPKATSKPQCHQAFWLSEGTGGKNTADIASSPLSKVCSREGGDKNQLRTMWWRNPQRDMAVRIIYSHLCNPSKFTQAALQKEQRLHTAMHPLHRQYFLLLQASIKGSAREGWIFFSKKKKIQILLGNLNEIDFSCVQLNLYCTLLNHCA